MEVGGSLIQSDWYPYKKGNLETDTRGEHHVKRKTEIRAMLLQAKECQRLPAKHQNPGERRE